MDQKLIHPSTRIIHLSDFWAPFDSQPSNLKYNLTAWFDVSLLLIRWIYQYPITSFLDDLASRIDRNSSELTRINLQEVTLIALIKSLYDQLKDGQIGYTVKPALNGQYGYVTSLNAMDSWREALDRYVANLIPPPPPPPDSPQLMSFYESRAITPKMGTFKLITMGAVNQVTGSGDRMARISLGRLKGESFHRLSGTHLIVAAPRVSN